MVICPNEQTNALGWQAYKKHSSFHQIFSTSLVVVAQYSDSSAICYELPVLWTTSYLHIMEQIGQRIYTSVLAYVRSLLADISPTIHRLRLCNTLPTSNTRA